MFSTPSLNLFQRHTAIHTLYSHDTRLWVIGNSGGRDSQTALQLVWTTLAQLPTAHLTKPLSIFSSNTLIETPKIVS